ncbi:WD40 repeat-containing protein [Heterostelium album PN500]|uniref:WD40 repeat-containing protein n=1 Tax=Heterostelium pallidum (strain ATCC 26659 / Pp 5 / PN500) TaxID=670386 RepID=D3BB87_HETP5|nr:WD40 repeat-containing protein [Heterostelium album PN500]EFA81294.1 WD40 repeat-containing protein [Heterostelium album PN500]|eukprot:XP_020433412.1 WD40 repeat-containing protein [Heterostelium album PN500]
MDNHLTSPSSGGIGSGGANGGKPMLFRNIFISLDPTFSFTLMDNFCRGVSAQKTTEIFNSLISLLDDHFLELLRVYIRINLQQQSTVGPNDDASFFSYKNVVNRMTSAYLKIHSSSTVEALLASQMQVLAANIQHFCLNNSGASSQQNSTATGTLSASLTPSFDLSCGSDTSNYSNYSSYSGNGSSLNNDEALIQFAISIINFICKSHDKLSPQTYYLMHLLYSETSSISNTGDQPRYNIELVKRIFFGKLIVPTLANMKPSASASALTKKVYVEISKIVSDLVFEKSLPEIGGTPNITSLNNNNNINNNILSKSTNGQKIGSLGIQQQLNEFFNMIVSQLRRSQSFTPPLKPSAVNKDEAYAYFIHYLKTESLQLDEFFKKAKDNGVANGERNYYLYGVFKELLNGLKAISMGGLGLTSSSSRTSIHASPQQHHQHHHHTTGRIRSTTGIVEAELKLSSLTQFSPSLAPKKDSHIELKKWSSDDLRSTYNGKSYKRRCAVLERQSKSKDILTFHIYTSDTNMTVRNIRVPLTVNIRALMSRLLNDQEMSDISYNKDVQDYELVVRYSEQLVILGVNNNGNDNASEAREVLTDTDLPLWIPEKKRASQPFSIYLKCLFPSLPNNNPMESPRSGLPSNNNNSGNNKNPVIMFVSLQLNPKAIIEETLLKHVIELDPTRLGLFLYDLDENAQGLLPYQIPSDRVLAGNKIGTMDILECNFRYAFEFTAINEAINITKLIEQDTSIETATMTLVNASLNHKNNNTITPRTDLNQFAIAIVSQNTRMPGFLNAGTRLCDYPLNLGDEILITSRQMISLIEKFEKKKHLSSSNDDQQHVAPSSSQMKQPDTSATPLVSTPAQPQTRYRFKVTWIGPKKEVKEYNINLSPLMLLGVPPLNTSLINPQSPGTPPSINIAPFEKRISIFLTNTLTLDPSLVASSKSNICINNDVKLCFVGDESPDKLNLFNILKKSGVTRREGLSNNAPPTPSPATTPGLNGQINGGADRDDQDLTGIKTSDWIYNQPEAPDYIVAFKMFYFSGLEVHQSTHPLFVTPESIFVVTYPSTALNESTIEYWMEIIQAKSPGSIVIVVGTSTEDPSKKTQYISQTLLSRYTNILHYLQVNIKNLKQVKALIHSIHSIAKQKQFRQKVPIPFVLLRNQLIETCKDASRHSRIPATSQAKIRSIAKSINLESRQIDDAMKYLLRCGDILYYRDDGDNELNDIVFLEPLWLSRVLSTVTNLKHQNGYLLMGGINQAWDEKYPRSIHTSLTHLLEQFEIMHSNTGGDNGDSIIVPMLFSEERPVVMAMLWPEFDHIRQQHERIYQFQFLPKGFFSRLSVKMLQNFDPLCIWQGGMVIQPAGQVWAGAAKNDHGQAFIEYNPGQYRLKMTVRDIKGGQLLKNLVDIISSFIMWYFPDRLTNTYVTCTHCIESRRKENATIFSLDFCEKEASHGNDFVMCSGVHQVKLSELAFEVTVHSNKFSIIPFKDLKIGPQLGAGSFANVYRGLWNQSEVAIKKLNLEEDDTTTEKFREFRHEAMLSGDLHHENIVSLKGVSMNPFCIITELLRYGDLSKFLRNTTDSFSWNTILRLSMDIAKGMSFLHSCKPMVIHRDLKSANILLGGTSIDTLIAKVSDFGLSIRNIDKEIKGRKVWNWRWLAPEIIKNQQYTEKIDIYSYGMVIWELITRDVPFDEYFEELKWNSVIEDKIIGGLRPTIPVECPESYQSLIKECWHEDPKKRPSFEEIIVKLKHMQQTFPLATKMDFKRAADHTVEASVDYSPMINQLDVSPCDTPGRINDSDMIVGANTTRVFADRHLPSPAGLEPIDSPRLHIGGADIGGSNADSDDSISVVSATPTMSTVSQFIPHSSSFVLEDPPIVFREFISSMLTSAIHCMLYVHNKQEPQVWCGCGDGSVTVFNTNSKSIMASYRSPESTRIIGITQVRKSKGKIVNPLDEEIQIWAYYSDGILIYDPKVPYKPTRIIKTSYISHLFDDGKSVVTNCKEKNMTAIKIYSKTVSYNYIN